MNLDVAPMENDVHNIKAQYTLSNMRIFYQSMFKWMTYCNIPEKEQVLLNIIGIVLKKNTGLQYILN